MVLLEQINRSSSFQYFGSPAGIAQAVPEINGTTFFSRQSKFAHYFIHQENNTTHIATFF
jgi:hypothetical protein